MRENEKHMVHLSMGSNMGDRKANIKRGITFLKETAIVLDTSLFYETQPVDFLEQEWFLNIAVKMETPLNPFQLLKEIKSIEKRVGRKESNIRFGPRILDIDIIFFDKEIINTSDLIIPHPRMHERCFVLQPLCAIEPEMVHPVSGKHLSSLMKNLNDPNQKVVEYP